MTTQKQPDAKQLKSTVHIPVGQNGRADFGHLWHSQRAQHSKAFTRPGEHPAVAGWLLYPDKREKMETTTERAFGPKMGAARVEARKSLQCNLILEGDRCFTTTHREDYRLYVLEEAALARRRRALPREERRKGERMELLTHYQQDFTQHIQRKRDPALPQPDNLAINPVLRGEFRTVQMDTYPGWDISEHCRSTPAQLQEQLQLNNDALFQETTQ